MNGSNHTPFLQWRASRLGSAKQDMRHGAQETSHGARDTSHGFNLQQDGSCAILLRHLAIAAERTGEAKGAQELWQALGVAPDCGESILSGQTVAQLDALEEASLLIARFLPAVRYPDEIERRARVKLAKMEVIPSGHVEVTGGLDFLNLVFDARNRVAFSEAMRGIPNARSHYHPPHDRIPFHFRRHIEGAGIVAWNPTGRTHVADQVTGRRVRCRRFAWLSLGGEALRTGRARELLRRLLPLAKTDSIEITRADVCFDYAMAGHGVLHSNLEARRKTECINGGYPLLSFQNAMGASQRHGGRSRFVTRGYSGLERYIRSSLEKESDWSATDRIKAIEERQVRQFAVRDFFRAELMFRPEKHRDWRRPDRFFEKMENGFKRVQLADTRLEPNPLWRTWFEATKIQGSHRMAHELDRYVRKGQVFHWEALDRLAAQTAKELLRHPAHLFDESRVRLQRALDQLLSV